MTAAWNVRKAGQISAKDATYGPFRRDDQPLESARISGRPVKRTGTHAAVIAALLAVSGCTTFMSGRSGTNAAAASAASTEPATSAAIIGAMAGGLIGGKVGQGLSEREKRIALEAEYRALEYTPSGQSVPWKADATGNSGEVTAAQPYRVGSQDCRQYSQTVTIGGQQRSARGTACRNPNGSWTPLT